MNVQAAQWIGTRNHQEDTYRVRFFPEGGLVIVCDGMGGHRGGAQAAAAAADTFVESFAEEEEEPLALRLEYALEDANDAVGELFGGSLPGGGTTLLAVFVGGGLLRWVSVGDSALLLWRHGRLSRLNEDHSMYGMLQRYLPPAELSRQSGAAHVLRSALMGGGRPELVDLPPTPFPLLPGDRLILCSDGADSVLTPGVPDEELAALLSRADATGLAAEIVSLCRRRAGEGAADNTTVLLLDSPV